MQQRRCSCRNDQTFQPRARRWDGEGKKLATLPRCGISLPLSPINISYRNPGRILRIKKSILQGGTGVRIATNHKRMRRASKLCRINDCCPSSSFTLADTMGYSIDSFVFPPLAKRSGTRLRIHRCQALNRSRCLLRVSASCKC